MTICVKIGKFETNITQHGLLGPSPVKVEFDIDWVSCGCYQMHIKQLTKREHPPFYDEINIHMSLEPEWIKKSIEMYPNAVERSRTECYKPFYHDYSTDKGMMDFGHDDFFQAFKVNSEEIILTVLNFVFGIPSRMSSFNIKFSELKRLQEFLDNPNGNGPETFYSGCKVSWD